MIDLKKLTDKDVGRKVIYKYFDTIKEGEILNWNSHYARVKFNKSENDGYLETGTYESLIENIYLDFIPDSMALRFTEPIEIITRADLMDLDDD